MSTLERSRQRSCQVLSCDCCLIDEKYFGPILWSSRQMQSNSVWTEFLRLADDRMTTARRWHNSRASAPVAYKLDQSQPSASVRARCTTNRRATREEIRFGLGLDRVRTITLSWSVGTTLVPAPRYYGSLVPARARESALHGSLLFAVITAAARTQNKISPKYRYRDSPRKTMPYVNQ